MKSETFTKARRRFPDPILNLNWNYVTNHAFDPHLAAKAINGYFTKDVTLATRPTRKASWSRLCHAQR